MRVLLVALVVLWAPTTWACGPDTDCTLGDRTYRISMPEGIDHPGALIYAHGYRGSAKGTMRNQALIDFAHQQGLALVALKSFQDDWRIPGVPAEPGTDGTPELSYIDAVLPALADRHGIDTDRLIMTGFSAGGMFTWFLACNRGDRFQAFVPVAGTFWRPVPENCPTYPVDLVHVHGTSDKIVPLGGRAIRTTHQGDVPLALARLRAAAGIDLAVDPVETVPELTCNANKGTTGRLVAMCTHPGGHSVKVVYIAAAFGMLQDAGVLPRP